MVHIDKNREIHPYFIMPNNLKLIPIPYKCVKLKNKRTTVAPKKSKTRPVMLRSDTLYIPLI